MSEPSTEMRLCRQCLVPKPIDEFRLRRRGGTERMRQCSSCHSQTEKLRRASRRSKLERDAAAKFALDLKNAKNHKQVVLLCNAVIKRFGGMGAFASAWLKQAETACGEKPGSKKACDFFQAGLRLMEYCEAQRPNMGQMSDEELRTRAMYEIQRFIEQQPEVAIAAANRLGWTVIPPATASL